MERGKWRGREMNGEKGREREGERDGDEWRGRER